MSFNIHNNLLKFCAGSMVVSASSGFLLGVYRADTKYKDWSKKQYLSKCIGLGIIGATLGSVTVLTFPILLPAVLLSKTMEYINPAE